MPKGKQSFDEFLNSPGPSTPRGRGRGRGAGPSRGGRGGGQAARSSFTTDYSNVPLDYNKINTKKYTKLSEYNDSTNPYGPNAESSTSNRSPYTPRGRGRGGGGRGGGRGGPGGGGSYEGGRIRSTPQPGAAGADTPVSSGSRTPVTGLGYHGRGHKFDPEISRIIDEGSSGYFKLRGGGGGRGNKFKSGATVGKDGVRWGGGAAPIFVKAGELFKDKEDQEPVLIQEQDQARVETREGQEENRAEEEGEEDLDDDNDGVLPAVSTWNSHRVDQSGGDSSDLEVEKMVDRDDEEEDDDDDLSADGEETDKDDQDDLDVLMQDATLSTAPDAVEAEDEGEEPELVVRMEEAVITDATTGSDPPRQIDEVETATIDPRSIIDVEETTMIVETNDVSLPTVDGDRDDDDITGQTVSLVAQIESPTQGAVEPAAAAAAAVPVQPVSETDEFDSLFVVDTEPQTTAQESSIVYDTHAASTLGSSTARPASPDQEEIVFRPRHYPQPQPITVDVPPAAPRAASPADVANAQRIVAPVPLNRRQKKALKREKRTRNKTKGKGKGKTKGDVRRPKTYEGSDIEWGSDGPPSHIMAVEMDEDDSDPELDEAILKDYLQGTRLGYTGDLKDVDASMDASDSPDDEDLTEAYDRAAMINGDEEFELDSAEEDNPDLESSSSNEDDEDGEDEVTTSEEDEGSDDDGDGDESSELGDIKFNLATGDLEMTGDLDDASDDDDLDNIFNGKDDWHDTEWFIRNMEAALDGDVDMGDRKARNKLFRSIEDGDFGDDWGLAPAKKKKSKSGIPLELQGQWEKDRQRKAERKRQRDLERVAAILDPHPATHGKKGKGKGKGLSRIDQAKLAHLIPESASRVAEMFDIPSDLDDDGPRGLASASTSRMGGRQRDFFPGGRGFPMLDASIRAFIVDEGKTTYSVPPMDKEGRKKVHMLAECYGLTSKSRGKGKARFTILTKTSRTGQNVNEDKVTRLVAAAAFPGGSFYKALHGKPSKKDKKAANGGTGGPGDRGSSARMRDGETVGEGAERIGTENIGHRLLSRMGWSEGGRIGRSDGGLENPIMAIVKNTKMGLGA